MHTGVGEVYTLTVYQPKTIAILGQLSKGAPNAPSRTGEEKTFHGKPCSSDE
jgi:hypothetical protein